MVWSPAVVVCGTSHPGSQAGWSSAWRQPLTTRACNRLQRSSTCLSVTISCRSHQPAACVARRGIEPCQAARFPAALVNPSRSSARAPRAYDTSTCIDRSRRSVFRSSSAGHLTPASCGGVRSSAASICYSSGVRSSHSSTSGSSRLRLIDHSASGSHPTWTSQSHTATSSPHCRSNARFCGSSSRHLRRCPTPHSRLRSLQPCASATLSTAITTGLGNVQSEVAAYAPYLPALVASVGSVGLPTFKATGTVKPP